MGDSIVETSPDGRYIRYGEVLGTGAFKTVYKAFDTEDALEVAWNKLQVDRLTTKELENVHKEVELLQKIQHKNIIRFHSSWRGETAEGRGTLDFITELMMSGTLRQYLKKAKAIKIKVLRRWCSNILEAIAYLHAQNPPIMHRDIKCDNVFINGHVGEVKIGDLGLSSVKNCEKALSVIGTPEFMAPELYEESYTEKLDIYAFGMCMLELVTMEYPYSECSNPAQIFKKVIGGEKPKGFNDLVDGQVKKVIAACLSRENDRPTAAELLTHPLFRDWESDDGLLSNLSLVHGTAENQELEAALREGRNSIGDWGIGMAIIDHSDLLHRAMFISKEAPPKEGEPALEVVASHEQGEIKIALQIPVHDAVKRVEFAFDPVRDSASELAQELITVFELHPSQLEMVALEIDKQVTEAKRQRQKFVAQGWGDAHSELAAIRARAGTKPVVAKGGKSSKWRENSMLENASQQQRKLPEPRINQGPGDISEEHKPNLPNLTRSEAPSRGVSNQNQSSSHNSLTKRSIVVVKKSADLSEDKQKSSSEYVSASDGQDREQGKGLVRTSSSNSRRGETSVLKAGQLPKESALNIKLMEQCAEGRYTAVMQILDKGASATFADLDGRTPLHVAASEGRPAICDLLLKQGARMDVKDRWGNTPLDCSKESDASGDVLSIFKQHGGDEDSARKPNGNMINMELMHFVSLGLLGRVREKLMGGASVRYGDNDSRTPLHVACSEGHAAVAELLLLNGAQIDKRDRFNHTAVDNAVASGHKDVLGVLRQYGSDLPRHLLDFGRERNHQLGVDIVEHAARGKVGAVKRDIQNGADVDFCDLDKRRPLHVACANGHFHIVDVLLKAGADMRVKDRWGSTPQDEARRNGHENIVDMLYKYRMGEAGEIFEGDSAIHASPVGKRKCIPSRNHVRRVQEELDYRISTNALHGIASDGFVKASSKMRTGSAFRDMRYSGDERGHRQR